MSSTRQNALIFGVGATGSNLAMMLAKTDNYNLHIVDMDKIEEKNTKVSMVYNSRHIGQSKVEVLRQEILKQNPSIEVYCHSYEVETIAHLKNIIMGDTETYTKFKYIFTCLDTLRTRVKIYKYVFDTLYNYQNSLNTANTTQLIDIGIGNHDSSNIQVFDYTMLENYLLSHDIPHDQIFNPIFRDKILRAINRIREPKKIEVCGNSTSIKINLFTTSYVIHLIETIHELDRVGHYDFDFNRPTDLQIIRSTF
jgi:hypothetical protein